MPIKKEDLEKIKATLKGVDVDALIAAAVATDEQPFAMPEVVVLTTAEATTRDENMKTVGKKEGETIGENKGKEITVKKIAKKLHLDESAIGNDIDKLEVAAAAKFKAGDAGLQAQVDLLLKDKETLTAEKAQLEGKASGAIFDAELISMFPASTSKLSNKEKLMLIKNELEFVQEGDKMVVKKNGVIIANPADHSPLPLNKVLEQVFVEREWTAKQAEGGRGGGSAAGGGGTGGAAGTKTLTSFTDAWKVNNVGKNPVSPEFDADLAKHTKDIPDFDYNA